VTVGKQRDARYRVRALRSPVARTRRLELILPDPRRAAEIVRLLSDPSTARWTLTMPFPYRPRDAQAFFRRARAARRSGASLAVHVVRRSDGALVGGMGLHDIDPTHLRAEVGYWVGREFRRQGFAQEALGALCRLAYHRLGLRRLEAGVFPGNVASIRVLRRAGFRREGRMRQSVRKAGVGQDVILYARLRDDPVARRAAAGSGPSRRGPSAAPTR